MLLFILGLLIVLVTLTPTQAQDDIILDSLSYSPDGRYVAGAGNRVAIWDGVTGSLLADIHLPFQKPDAIFMDSAWSPDSRRLALASDDRRVRILDLSDDAEPFGSLLTEFELTTFLFVRSIAWSPDGNFIIIGGDGTTAQLEFWDASTYEFVRVSPYAVAAYQMEWHPDPQRNLLAVTSVNQNGAKIVDTTEDASSATTWLCGECAPDAFALPVAWNGNGTLLAIGHNDGNIFIVNVETEAVVTRMQTEIGVSILLWTHDNQHIVSMSQAGLQIWDSETGDLLYSPAVVEPRRIVLHPFNDAIFYFDRAANLGVNVEISTLLESTPTAVPPTSILMTPTLSPTTTPKSTHLSAQ